jgi:hypothetical protein
MARWTVPRTDHVAAGSGFEDVAQFRIVQVNGFRRTTCVSEPEAELEDREGMTERALFTILQTGNVAALDKCAGLADQINTRLLQLQFKDFDQPSEVETLGYFWSGPPQFSKNYNSSKFDRGATISALAVSRLVFED